MWLERRGTGRMEVVMFTVTRRLGGHASYCALRRWDTCRRGCPLGRHRVTGSVHLPGQTVHVSNSPICRCTATGHWQTMVLE